MVFDCVFLIVTHVLPGMSLYNISFSYEQAGNIPRAVECAREALSIRQAALPPSHPDVMDAAKKVRRLESRIQGR